jgi:cyclophilin family peptidyl-prolyl cis-trans isomerase/HEAT repeat protein
MMTGRRLLPAIGLLLCAASTNAQVPDTSALRARLRSRDADMQRFALLELGRFELPSLLPIIVPSLQSSLPEVRAQAVDAIGQAAQGWRSAPPLRRTAISPESVVEALVARLKVETDPSVRAAISETIGRLPYATGEQVGAATRVLLEIAPGDTVIDRLGIATGLDNLVRFSRTLLPDPAGVKAKLRGLAGSGPSRDARVRRLALEALSIFGAVDAIDDALLKRAASDPDIQVRRLAMRAAGSRSTAVARDMLAAGVKDDASMVRMEALGALGSIGDDSVCEFARAAAGDRDVHVALRAIDELARCGGSDESVALLERAASDQSDAGSPRGWHKTAHALLALAAANPERARAALPRFVESKQWPLRLYAARAATVLRDQSALAELWRDPDKNVRQAATTALVALGVINEAAAPAADPPSPARSSVDAAELRDLSLLRARVTVRYCGSFEMALLPIEAPLTVSRFVSLAESGRFNGVMIHRVLPNVAAEAAQPLEDPDGLAVLTRDEAGPWPHVRGAVGVNDESSFFVDLTDNPQFDHQFTVFAQLLNGMDVVDALLEGDIIERVDILKP